MDDKNSDDLKPLTMKEAEDWLCDLDEKVALEADINYTNTLILENLVLHLHHQRLINGDQFLLGLQEVAAHQEGKVSRSTTLQLLRDLRLRLPSVLPDDEADGALPN